MALNRVALFASLNSEYETPPELYDKLDKVFHFNLDVCASDQNHKCIHYITEAQDALRPGFSWATYFGPHADVTMAWMNPPYGRGIGAWVQRAAETWHQGGSIVALLPSRTDTDWFQKIVLDAPAILLLKHRVKFLLPCIVCGAKTHWMYPVKSVTIPADLAGATLDLSHGLPLCDAHRPMDGKIKRWCTAPFPSCVAFFVQPRRLPPMIRYVFADLGRIISEPRS